MSVRVYELYPWSGGFTNQSRRYRGDITAVAAVSNRQAHLFANKVIWASDPAKPLGILWKYARGAGGPGDHLRFDGSHAYGHQIGHRSGEREIRSWMLGVLSEGSGGRA